MIGASISMAADSIQVGVRKFSEKPMIMLALNNGLGTAGLHISLSFEDARALAVKMENAIAAYRIMESSALSEDSE